MAKFYCPTKLSENISETPEGYLLCVGVPIARTGVMEYGQGETPLEVGEDGIVYVSRDAEEVFSKPTMASFEGKSVTIRHPEEFVNPTNWKELSKGAAHNIRRGSERDEDGEEVLLADLLITEAFAISLVKNGLREVSCGYEAEYEQTGVGTGKQTKIVGNHIALVEEGRAGSSYAIQDHKGKVTMGTKIADRLKKLIGKTIDEAVAEGEKATKEKTAKTVKTKIKDESATPKAVKSAGSETNTVMDEEEKKKAYDEMKAAHDAMGKMLDSMKPAKDESEEESSEEESGDESEEKEKKEDESEDEGEEGALMERVKALEVALAKLLEGRSDDEAEEEESEDESEEEEESEDASLEGEEAEESQKKTGDAARAEILVPGFKLPKKGDVKVAALQAAMKTDEGKTLLTSLNGGKKPTFDSAEKVSTLFVAASEIMKLRNGTGLEKTKDTKTQPITFESFDATKEDMTAEKMNDLNAAHYKSQKAGN